MNNASYICVCNRANHSQNYVLIVVKISINFILTVVAYMYLKIIFDLPRKEQKKTLK